MKIFILEDNPERIKSFKEKYYDDILTIVNNVNKAKKMLLKIDDYDFLFLDHDLEGETYVNSHNENTGYQIAKFIVENDIQIDSTIIIHSLNPVGSKNMYNILEKAKFKVLKIPFFNLL